MRNLSGPQRRFVRLVQFFAFLLKPTMMISSILARRGGIAVARRCFSDATTSAKPRNPLRRTNVTAKERAALRKERKEKGIRYLQEHGAATEQAASSSSGSLTNVGSSRWLWYMGVAVPTGILVWGFNDPDSPPAKLSDMIGLTGLVSGFTEDFAKPSHDKLLPDWSQMPNVPHDIPVPHTLVLDLEETLVSSTWDRRYGWRHAKRPGVDKFLQEMAQYYEIVLYSPSIDGIAEPVVNSLDKSGCIMHRLYRDATHYHNGIHVKDLDKLNRNVKRMVILDDDPEAVAFHPDNLIRVKPYTDPNDREDDTLKRITPLLVEIAREGYNDVPQILRQFRGMDADQIADEQERRIENLKVKRQKRAQRGLGALASGARAMPEPELPPAPDQQSAPQQLTAKDLVGSAPPPIDGSDGMMGWLNRRNKEKEEEHMRKMEKWNEVMLKKQQAKREAAEAQARGTN